MNTSNKRVNTYYFNNKYTKFTKKCNNNNSNYCLIPEIKFINTREHNSDKYNFITIELLHNRFNEEHLENDDIPLEENSNDNNNIKNIQRQQKLYYLRMMKIT